MPSATRSPLTILFITQVYPPDPAAGGQHLADAAAELARRGHRVIVFTANRGYDDPSIRYPSRETAHGVAIRRLPASSFGKRSIALRMLAAMCFLAQAVLGALRIRGLNRVVVLTAPPISSAAAALLSFRRRVGVIYWIMDLNPDQMIALGVLRRGSPLVRLLDFLNRVVLRRAAAVVVCDRHMAARCRAKLDPGARLHVVTPWPLDEHLEPVAHEQNPFRDAEGMNGRRVVMYSGNHALTNPIRTILDAAARVADEPRLLFVFIGGGIRKREVEAAAAPNIRSLPYQPLNRIKYSLSAADVHLATIGNAFVGIVHPCKVYGAMALGRPVLALGPRESHLADLACRGIGWHVPVDDVDAAERVLREIATVDERELERLGRRAQQLVRDEFDTVSLRRQFCDVVEG